LQSESELWKREPEAGLIFVRLLDVEPELVYDALDRDRRRPLAELRERVVGLAAAFRNRSTAPLLVANFSLDRSSLDPFDASKPTGLGHLVAAENQALAQQLAELPDVHVFDYAGIVTNVGTARFFDRKLWTLAKAAASHDGQIALAHGIARAVRAVTRAALKCIVVDLDNTLWGGVVGDDGIGGIKLGDDGGGAPFKELQRALKSLRARGFLLAIASKNDRMTALDAIDQHPEMILRSGDFAAIAISWEPKPAGLEAIAHALNLGLDSLLFVDDNPVERASVRAALPVVQVLELPADPMGFADTLLVTPGLERPRLLAEDRQRAEMMSADKSRASMRDQASSMAEFLHGLRMLARVGRASERELERIHQLISKTNQWNLTTRRHSLDEVRRLAASTNADVAWMRVEDRYGDLGLVCVAILCEREDAIEVDTLLMSCRVMGRQVEDAFLAYLGELARQRGALRLRGVFRPTAKNQPVHRFYAERGFERTAGSADEEIWERALTDVWPVWPPHIARLDADSTSEACR
jgi:FkbH-like protein